MLDYESRRRFAIGERFRPIISPEMRTAASAADATDSTAACLASIHSLIKGSVRVEEGQAEWGHFVASSDFSNDFGLSK